MTLNLQADFLALKPSHNLSAGFPKSMVLLDCETTGGKASYHRIIEIGLIIIENGQLVEQWQTFLDPERPLPIFIQNLTGIKPEMLRKAPLFSDIAELLLQKLENRVLVAHNARFDYGFLKNEFSRIGINYTTKPLCSVKFSRSMFPQFRRHGLDQIIKRFKFSIENRHRALDDALMIYKFFLSSTSLFNDAEIEATCEQLVKTTTLPALLDPKEIKRLPNSPGVYYFYDDKGGLLYIGKSVNIRNRVLNHFSQDHKNHKDLKMSGLIAHIDYVSTPSDFGAQLVESREIKNKQPLFNTRLRKVKKLIQLQLLSNKAGYLIPRLKTVELEGSLSKQAESYGLFRTRKQALSKLEKLADQFFLCHQLLGLEGRNTKNAPCFRFQLKRCFGACCQKEEPDQYNLRLMTALKEYKKQVWPYPGPVLIIEEGKYDPKSDSAERQFHLLDQWIYKAKLTSEHELFEHGLIATDNITNQAWLTKQKTQHENQLSEQIEDNDLLDDFDLDTYFILVRFLLDPSKHSLHGIKVIPLHYSLPN